MKMLSHKTLCGADSVIILCVIIESQGPLLGKKERRGDASLCQHSLKVGKGFHDFHGTFKGADHNVS